MEVGKWLRFILCVQVSALASDLIYCPCICFNILLERVTRWRYRWDEFCSLGCYFCINWMLEYEWVRLKRNRTIICKALNTNEIPHLIVTIKSWLNLHTASCEHPNWMPLNRQKHFPYLLSSIHLCAIQWTHLTANLVRWLLHLPATLSFTTILRKIISFYCIY